MDDAAKLPLFPLGSVLFPGIPIQLHIFEERYKAMMQRCLNEEQDFGVILIEEGREALGPIARTHSFGTTARILKVQPLPEGRMDLIAVGQQRFRVDKLDRDSEPYLQGFVEFLSEGDATEDDDRHASALLPLIQEYVELLGNGEGESGLNYSRLPREARALGYAAAYLLHVPQYQKQQLLEIVSLPELLTAVQASYRNQIDLLKIVKDRGLEPPEGPTGPSLN